MIRIQGIAKVDRLTKQLVNRISPGEIAVICHRDLDGPAAQALIRRRVAAVVNAECSISGRYPNLGPHLLLKSGIYVLDNVGPQVMDQLTDGSPVQIIGDSLFQNGTLIAQGEPLQQELVEHRMEQAKSNLGEELQKFVQNTLSFVTAEQGLLLDPTEIPELGTDLNGKHVLVVVRGEDCQEDLRAIRSYLQEEKPVLIGVDGGADVLTESGYRPDIIIGDMDSVSDRALTSGAELVLHAYANQVAPGQARLDKLGLQRKLFPCPGTSEDVALLLAFEKGAELIVAVGTHFSLIDFLDKARGGMASTFLVRLKVGSRLVDAKGVSRLYRGKFPVGYLAYLIGVAITVALIITLFSPKVQSVLQFLGMRLRMLLGL